MPFQTMLWELQSIYSHHFSPEKKGSETPDPAEEFSLNPHQPHDLECPLSAPSPSGLVCKMKRDF